MMSPIDQARKFAITAHGDQKYGSHPYVSHLDEVAAIVRQYMMADSDIEPTVAYLHDVLEDTPATLGSLAQTFSWHVAAVVKLLTDPPGETRKDRKMAMYRQLADHVGDPHAPLAYLEEQQVDTARFVKVCDRMANVRACIREDRMDLLQKYRDEHAEFREHVYKTGAVSELLHRKVQCDLDKLIELSKEGYFREVYRALGHLYGVTILYPIEDRPPVIKIDYRGYIPSEVRDDLGTALGATCYTDVYDDDLSCRTLRYGLVWKES